MAGNTESMQPDIVFTRFDQDELPKCFKWLHEPKKHTVKAASGEGLRIYMDAKSDFWQKSYYDPPLIVDSGHFLYASVSEERVVMETTFDINGINQFDQAGLMVRLDNDHWIKTGIEYVDGAPRLSCVVTNKYSDWSTQAWPSMTLSIRVYKIGNDYVVENKAAHSDTWDFIRIAHLDNGKDKPEGVQMGVMACAPADVGGSTLFRYLSIKKSEGYHHTN